MAAATAVLALAVSGSSSAGTQIDYVALGDSVAAGYGLGANVAPCARAVLGYPGRVLDRLERRHSQVRFSLLACSGATAAPAEPPELGLRGQVDDALERLSGRAALVSITIGINDLEWWNLIRVAQLLRADRSTFERWLVRETDGVRRLVRRQLARLLARPGVRIVLTNYFNPLNPASPLFTQPLVCPNLGRCRARVGEAVSTLNTAIRQAPRGLAGEARVRLATIRSAFRGHEAARPDCGSGPPSAASTWIQGDCLHPNAAGAAVIARAVDRQARRLGL